MSLRALRRTDPSPSAVSVSVAYPGPAGSHTASAAAALFPSARLVPLAGFRAVADAVIVDGRRARRAADRELARRRRSPRRTTCSTSARSRSSPRRCCRSATAWPARRAIALEDDPRSCARTRRRSTSAATCSRGMPQASPFAVADDRRGRAAGGRGRRSDRRSRSSSPEAVVALRPDACSPTTSATSTAFTRFVSIAPLHAHRRRRANGAHGVLVRDAAPAGRAPRGDRAVRARRARSRSGSSRGRCRRRRGSTASTPSSPGIRSTRRCGVALRELEAVTRELRVVGVYEGHEERSDDAPP